MDLIYINKFTVNPANVLPFTPQEGRVYKVIKEGNSLNVLVGADQIWLTGETTTLPAYSCQATLITPQNYSSLLYTPEDKVTVYSKFNISSIVESSNKEREDLSNEIYTQIAGIETLDTGLFESLGKVATYINSTFSDKYEDGWPEVDLTGLLRFSHHSDGFNVGNALKYQKRYLTNGHTKSRQLEDLYKAVHYLLYQIDSHSNEM